MKKTITSNEVSTFLRQPPRYLKTFTLIISSILLFATFFLGCKKDNFKDEVSGDCPVVVATDPMDKAVDVALNKLISITFNTNMDATTINSSTFLIKQGTTVINGVYAATANPKMFTFKPDVALLPFLLYSGTVTTGAKDKFSTAMVSDYVWTFTTIPVVSLSALPLTGGTVAGAGGYAQGSAATVVATPNAGFTFTNWTEGATVVSTSSSYQFTMAGNRTLVANFAAIPVGNLALVLSSSPAAGGTTLGAGAYATGSTVTATAAANAGYTFVNWTDGATIVSTSTSYQFVLITNRTLVANFSLIPASQFAVVLSSNPVAGGTTSGGGAFASGTSVTINAAANTGYTFTNWTEGATIVSTSASYTFALTANRNLVANFTLNAYTLNVTAVNGTVTKTPNQPTYNHGTTAVLTATPNAGYVFTSWSGDASGTTNPLTVTMNGNKNITANFTAVVVPPLFSSQFAAFGLAGLTNQGIFTVINNGSIGTPGASTTVTGFHDMTGDKYIETPLNIGNVKDGRIYTAGPPPVIFGAGGPFGGNATTKAIADAGLLSATNFYNSISPANRPGGTVQAQELGGLTLFAGTYKAASGPFEIINGDLTLDAQGNPNAVWVFQAPSSLTVGSTIPRSVKLIGGAQAKNVYWYVGSSAVINYAGGGTMVGTIISSAGGTLSSPANSTNTLVQTVLDGRLISINASVTMVNTIINVPQ